MGQLYRPSDSVRSLRDERFTLGLPPEEYRTDSRRDYARLIHCPSFRRLQGKTQLFPGVESDFFRNRLTHSLEVAQIAKSIGIRLNANYNDSGKLKKNKGQPNLKLDLDLIEFAALAHDLGHPPFGHQGEEALDSCMLNHGGFEGNAQTLRILTKVEKKFYSEEKVIQDGIDKRVGLNLTMRSLASILKYDNPIPVTVSQRKAYAGEKKRAKLKPVKGYYTCDAEIVEQIKKSVLGTRNYSAKKLKTVECHIMDIADDIAYSTYDLEDGFKAGFISPLDLLYPDRALLLKVTLKVNENLAKEKINRKLDTNEVRDYLQREILWMEEVEETQDFDAEIKGGQYFMEFVRPQVHNQYKISKLIAGHGGLRTGFTSSLVGRFIRGVNLEYNKEDPALSKAVLNDETRILVEILKTFTYLSQINSPRLKIAEFRGKEIVTKIFKTLSTDNNYQLMPYDVQAIFEVADKKYRPRIICDYIASMTDKYAIEFYGRLTSEVPATIFKPY